LDSALAANPVEEKSLSDMGLRYDLTLPLTRFYAANKNELQTPFKVIQTDRVFRAERPQKGRSREFVQCDIDILGDNSPNAEVELIDVTARALMNIGFKDFYINVNDRRILRNMLESMGFAADTLDSVCISFDKLDKIGPDGVAAELTEKGMPEKSVKVLKDFLADSSDNITLESVVAKCSNPSVADDLKYIIETATAVADGKYKIKYCPSLVRGQGYYTGAVFEIATPLFGGAVGGGGRYDNLIGKFIGQQVPAVGFSIGFERICSILLEQNYKIPNEREKCAFLYDDSISFAQVMKFAENLRKDYNVAIIKKAKKPGPQYDMLEKQGYTKFASVRDGQIVVK
ncbi:MAG: ATP phosphoribosyltransferase regulatory subunit, partial [Treponema sp.]|nr:ATP phosphoribosyltransferase regulatory subunit [Treponema sp.]